MRTDDLVDLLAAEVTPVAPQATARCLGQAMLAGVPLAMALMLLFFGVRPDLAEVITSPMFWTKVLFALSVGVSGYVTLQRLARPGVAAGLAWLGVVVPVLVIWGLALLAWHAADPGTRPDLLWGQTWRVCVLSISLIALPVFVAVMVALRGLAPTRPVLAGAAAGVLASGAGATVYAFHCPELAAPFLAVWYVSGMAVPAVAGALLGPRLLRW